MPLCTRCGTEQPLTNFEKHPKLVGGYRRQCRECRREMSRIRYAENPERYRAKYAAWSAKPENKEWLRRWQQENAERIRDASKAPHRIEAKRAYAQQPHRREAQRVSFSAWYVRNQDKAKAQRAVNHAIRDGKLVTMLCWVCGEKAEAHHASYAEDARLDVTWLCRGHHKEVHRKLP